jgi:hypothetical protein
MQKEEASGIILYSIQGLECSNWTTIMAEKHKNQMPSSIGD